MTAPVLQPRRIAVSIGARLTVPVVLLVLAVALGAYVGMVRTSRATLLRSKETAADMVAKLTALSVMPAVVFGDETEIKRAVADLATNPEVSDVDVWAWLPEERAAGAAPLASFRRGRESSLVRPTSADRARTRDADSVRIMEPVISPEGKIVALLAVRFSTERETAALTQLTRQILWVSGGTALCLGIGILFAIRRIVVVPLRRLQRAAQRLAGGQQDNADVIKNPGRIDDEVVQLATAFGNMSDAVRDREARLAVRNAELRLILDSVDQGFLTVRPDGTLLPERSAILERWLGNLGDNATIWDVAGRVDPKARSWAESAWSQISDDFLPLEVSLAQLPSRLSREGKHFDFAYHPVMAEERLERMVVVLTDVTAEVERQRALAVQHEFSVLVDQFVRDRRAFHDFWNEASALVRRIVEPREEAFDGLRRDIHTLKGNARFFGLTRLSSLCHSLEDAMQERGENVLSQLERDGLSEAWESLRIRIEPLMHGATAFIEISKDEYQRLVDAIGMRRSPAELDALVRGLRQEPTERRLSRAKELLFEACRKLGKSLPTVAIAHNDLRVSPSRLSPFWSVLPHVLSNAADHGIEPDQERRAAGKTVPANVSLSTSISNGEFIVEVGDDGRGIDWDRVRALAKARDLPYRTQADLEQALFSDGFSLKERVTEVSGRGVGLAALRNVVSALSGHCELKTLPGQGVTWRFRFPARSLMGGETEPDAAGSFDLRAG